MLVLHYGLLVLLLVVMEDGSGCRNRMVLLSSLRAGSVGCAVMALDHVVLASWLLWVVMLPFWFWIIMLLWLSCWLLFPLVAAAMMALDPHDVLQS